MQKNTAGQAVTLYVVDASTGLPKTGDAANILVYVSKDDGAVTPVAANSGVPTECDATNAKGDYKIALSQSETNADKLRFSGKSATASVVVVPLTEYPTTAPAAAPTANEVADALLNRNVAGGSSAGRLVKEALYPLRNRWAINAGTLTVYATDDTTPAFTTVITSSPTASTVTESDPTA